MYVDISDIIPVVEEMGYKIKDPWDIVSTFESMVAEYAGSKHAVAVD